MRNVRNILLGCLAFYCFIFVSSADAAEMNFSVQAVIPENQMDKSKSYFDLKVTPDQSQDLSISMKNDTDKDVTIEVAINTATTNDNGIADYSGTNKEQDSTLKYNLKDFIEVDNEVTIPAKTEKTITAHLKMPTDSFDGVLLGGFTFIEKESAESKEEKEGTQVINKYAYTIGIQLQETDTTIEPELVLNNVEPAQVNFRNVIQANIQNTEAAIIKDLTVDGKIYKKNSKNVLYEAKRTGLRIAPNSNFNYGISLNNEEFKPGIYVFKGVATSENNEWKFEKEFTIKGDIAKKLNSEAVELDKDYSMYIYLGIGLVILILILIIVILLKKVKSKE